MSLLSDPRVFNMVIMSLYAANVIRWAWHGSLVDSAYWSCALGITACVTWGYDR